MPKPFRSVLAGYIRSRLYKMGEPIRFTGNTFQNVVNTADLDALEEVAHYSLVADDEMFLSKAREVFGNENSLHE